MSKDSNNKLDLTSLNKKNSADASRAQSIKTTQSQPSFDKRLTMDSKPNYGMKLVVEDCSAIYHEVDEKYNKDK